MPLRSARKRKAVNYNEETQAKQFDIGGTRKATKTGSKVPSAIKELGSKPGYRGNAPNKSAPQATILPTMGALPKRNARGQLVFKDHPEFTPNLTPKQVLQMGSFGGTYFRPITSGVTMESYTNVHKEFPMDWFEALDLKTDVISKTYRESANKYGVKCGGGLDMWEGSGWISNIDPYGWFQWYCRFYLGRRSTDDDRQIARGRGVMSDKGRFRNQLIGRCARAGKAFGDVSVSPVIRQALQHWGYQLTKHDFDKYVKLKRLA
jgi:hypothetical protein